MNSAMFSTVRSETEFRRAPYRFQTSAVHATWVAIVLGLPIALSPARGQDVAADSSTTELPKQHPSSSQEDESLADETWKSLFDGQALGDWKSTVFGGEGAVQVSDGNLVLRPGSPLTGVTWKGTELPSGSYELELEAKKTQGIDFFCGLTFPVGDNHCSLIVGGWAGSVVGLSNIDDQDASRNDTTRYLSFAKDRWYKIRVQVTDERIRAWIDDELVVDQELEGKRISVRAEVLLSRPLGICTFETEAAFRNLRWKPLP